MKLGTGEVLVDWQGFNQIAADQCKTLMARQRSGGSASSDTTCWMIVSMIDSRWHEFPVYTKNP